MLYLYQPQGLKRSLWEGIKRASEIVGTGIVLWDGAHEEKVVADLIRQSALKGEGEEPMRFIPEEVSTDSNMLFLLMDLSEETMQLFLRALRENNCHIPLKAMRTETNVSWTLGYLIKDVAAEARLMQNLMQLHHLVQASDDFPEENYRPAEWQRFLKAKSESMELLAEMGKRTISYEEVIAQKERFNQAVLRLFQKEESS